MGTILRIIVHSSDTATTWRNVHAEFAVRFTDVAWDGAKLLVLARHPDGSLLGTMNGNIVHSTDVGASWDSTAAVVSLEKSYLLLTDDGWQSYEVRPFKFANRKFHLSRLRDGQIALPGINGQLLLLNRSGESDLIDTGLEDDLTVCEQLPSGAVIAGGSEGGLAMSSDPTHGGWEQLHSMRTLSPPVRMSHSCGTAMRAFAHS